MFQDPTEHHSATKPFDEAERPTAPQSSSSNAGVLRRLIEWLKKLFGITSRSQQIEQLASAVYRDLREQRQGFRLHVTLGRYEATPDVVHAATVTVMNRLLSNVWQDGRVNESEKRLISQVSTMLGISPGLTTHLNLEAAKKRFGKAYERAMSDGVIDDEEQEYLNHIADVAGIEGFDAFLEAYFYEQSEAGKAAAKREADEAARLAAILRAEREAEELALLRARSAPSPMRHFGSTTYVRGYRRKDGTYVQPHSRRR